MNIRPLSLRDIPLPAYMRSKEEYAKYLEKVLSQNDDNVGNDHVNHRKNEED